MALFIVKATSKDEQEYLQFVKDRAASEWKNYSDMARSFVRVRVEQEGELWFLDFSPSFPPFQYFLWGMAFFLWFLGVPAVWVVSLAVIGGFIGLWFTPYLYILVMYLGFKKRRETWPNMKHLTKREAIDYLLGWRV